MSGCAFSFSAALFAIIFELFGFIKVDLQQTTDERRQDSTLYTFSVPIHSPL